MKPVPVHRCVAVLLIAAMGHARAEHVINVLVENDTFTGTDRHYTSGVMLNYVSGVDDGPKRLRKWGIRFPGIEAEDQMHVSVSLGHEIYTPDDIDATEPLPDQRPYAGYAYLATGFSSANDDEIESWRISLGLVGPGAKAQYVQNTVHELIDVDEAAGWDNQLQDEWVVSIAYEKKWLDRAWRRQLSFMEFDFIPHVNAAIGTLNNQVGLGGVLRAGQGLRKDYGPPKVRPSMPLSQYHLPDTGSGWYFFLGVDARYVAQNIFLDGNNFRSSPGVERKDFVADLQTGFVWNTNRFRLGYTYVVRTREFEGQDQGDVFGSLSMSAHF